MIITLFESVHKAYTRPEQIISAEWVDVAAFLTTFQQAETKDEVPLFNFWEFDINGEPGRKYRYENNIRQEAYETLPGTIRRCKANAKKCWGIILDYDGEKNIAEASRGLAGYSYALYTTFRHTPNTHKFRIAIPFREGISRESFAKKKTSISKTFEAVDHASFSESQSFYLHSGNPQYAYSCIGEGDFVDANWFEDEIIPPMVPMAKREFDGDSDVYKELLIESLLTCSGLHYANDKSKHGVLTLVALCKSAGLSFAEFDTICWAIAAPDSSLQNQALRSAAWQGWVPFSGITARVREEFITAYGGTSKFGNSEDSLSKQVRLMKEKLRRRNA